MKKKYFTEEEKKAARKIESRKYYDKIRKPPLTEEEIERLKEEKIKRRKEYEKEYYKKNKEKILKQAKEYFKDNQKIKQEKNNKRYKERRTEDPLYRLTTNIRRTIRCSLKNSGYSKKSRSYDILGCSYEEFKEHLESKFEPWMNWDNNGLYNGEEGYGWDIDHIIPISSAKSEEDIICLNHYTNLQPLCSYVNRVIKKDTIITIKKENNVSSIYVK